MSAPTTQAPTGQSEPTAAPTGIEALRAWLAAAALDARRYAHGMVAWDADDQPLHLDAAGALRTLDALVATAALATDMTADAVRYARTLDAVSDTLDRIEARGGDSWERTLLVREIRGVVGEP